MEMEKVSFQLNASKIRYQLFNGREYLIAPATILRSKVLSGSKGALYYPPEEIDRDALSWNHMPILLNHPTRNGQHVSGRDPEIIASSGLGTVYMASSSGGKLGTELWFDIEAVRNRDKNLPDRHKILPRLESGKPIELSTGLFTDNHPAPNGSVHNGEAYSFIARNYRPDHLAILPDQQGACSVRDGCGVNVNEDKGTVTSGGLTIKLNPSPEQSLLSSFWSWLTSNAGKFGNPQSVETGLFKKHGAGTGKGEVHYAAQAGAMNLTSEDRALGHEAKLQADAGSNPPNWSVDEDLWDKAKDAASKNYEEGGDEYWAVVTHIYKKMGGAIQGKTENEETVTQATVVNTNSNEEILMPMTREQTIQHLTSNCDCWKGKEKVLANAELFTDQDIAKLYEGVENGKKLVEQNQQLQLTANAYTQMVKAAKRNGADLEDDEDEEKIVKLDEEEEDEVIVKNQRQQKGHKMTMREMLANATPEEQSVWNNAVEIERKERNRVISLLTANVAQEKKADAAKKLQGKPLNELKDLLELLPPRADVQNQRQVTSIYDSEGISFAGVGHVQPVGLTENEQNDVLDIETARKEYDPRLIKAV